MPNSLAPPQTTHPLVFPDGTRDPNTVFLKPVIRHPRWDVGDYTYAHSFQAPEDWAARLAPYLHEAAPEMLRIGRFCQIADGVRFITASASHRMDGFSTYPFAIFSGFGEGRASLPGPGADTVIGHDVWVGQGATLLPGCRIGSGCIIGAGAVVRGTVPPYSIVSGNPAVLVRRRFDTEVIEALLSLAWWDWPPEQILAQEHVICSGDLSALGG